MAKGDRNMETRRPLLAGGALSLVVAILGGVLATTTAGLAASSVAIPISGTVDGLPESVSVSGLARITSTLVKTDAKFHHPPRVILGFDLHNVSGTGVSTGTRYVTRSRDEMLRRLVAADVVELTFPLQPKVAKGITAARAGLASFTLNFDVNTGALTGGSGTVSTPGS
jgi:hypothetical protein